MVIRLFRRLVILSVIATFITLGALVSVLGPIRPPEMKHTQKNIRQNVISNEKGNDQKMEEHFKQMMKGTKHCQKLRFLKRGSHKNTDTALVSYPGSGNTWLRHLLQEATGIYTGSVFRTDKPLKRGFPGEEIIDDRVAVVKTHESKKEKLDIYKRVILLVRNPYKTAMAEYTRMKTGNNHTGHVSKIFTWTPAWNKYFMGFLPHWLMFNRNMLARTKQMLVIKYEDLKHDPIHEMKRILEFANLKSSDDILNCMAYNSEGQFHRKSISLAANAFSREMVSKAREYIDIVNKGMKEKYGVEIDGTVPTNKTG